ncbi:MAG: lactate utilization protein [Chloroflexi bacterium]|nr:lactate utilization protein [Chloroflexota bacterium]
MASREGFLKAVREATEAGRRDAPAPAHASAPLSAEAAQPARQRTGPPQGEILALLERMAGLQGWKFHRVASHMDAVGVVITLAETLGARQVVRSTHEVLGRVLVDSFLAARGIQTVVMAYDAKDPLASREALRQAALRADLGVTGVDYVIAETATAVILPRRGVSRLVSLAPPVHLALVEAEQVVESLDDLLALRKGAFLKGEMGSYMSFISGPSRTGDIEQTIVVGVHGPKEVHLVLIAP